MIIFFGLISCSKSQKKEKIIIETDNISTTASFIQQNGNTVKTRFSAPKNYKWIEENPNSFGEFLVNFTLKKYGAQILRFDGNPIATQSLHEAIYDIDTGEKDLQQCADSVIRLYAEYLWKQDRKDEIAFHFTNGDLVKWTDYRDGYRAFVM